MTSRASYESYRDQSKKTFYENLYIKGYLEFGITITPNKAFFLEIIRVDSNLLEPTAEFFNRGDRWPGEHLFNTRGRGGLQQRSTDTVWRKFFLPFFFALSHCKSCESLFTCVQVAVSGFTEAFCL